ncbi:MAG: SdiA-regulated domain-containing protein [Bacteroidota bacterium]
MASSSFMNITTQILSRLPVLIACAVLLQGSNCRQPSGAGRVPATSMERLPYNLEEPALTINFANAELKEISGLSPTDTPGVYCAIADERGEIFFINSEKAGEITRRVLFRDKGDFESLEMVGKVLYALKSNGALFEIEHWQEGGDKMEVHEYKTPLQYDDLEGLCYDPKRNALLLATKEDPLSDVSRKIYAFSLKTKTLEPNPVYTIDPQEVNRILPYDLGEKQHYFSPSGIAIHPITKEVYVISTALKRLVVLNPETGAIKSVVRLDKGLLPQPEGIAFDAQGNLFLSSEGKKQEGLLLKFNYIH